IDLFVCAVEIEAGARRSSYAETAHKRLIAMVTAAHCEPVAVRERSEIMRMRCVHDKTDHPSTIFGWSDHSQARQFRHSLERILRKIDIVLKNLGAADSFQIIDCRGETNRAGDIWSAGFKTVRWFFVCALFQGHADNHFAAAMIRGRRLQNFRPPVEHADPG